MCTQSAYHQQVSINTPPPTELVPYLQQVHAADGGTIGGCEVQWGVSPGIRFIHLLVSHGRRQQAQQLYGVTHTAVNREKLYIQGSPMAAVNRLSNSMGSRTQLSTNIHSLVLHGCYQWSGSATLWGHVHSCQHRNTVHSLVSHGCYQQAQQLYGVTHTAVNREKLYVQGSLMAAVNRLSNSMGTHTQLSTEKRCPFNGLPWLPSATLWGHAHSRQQRKLYIHRSPMAAVNRLSNSIGSRTQPSTEKTVHSQVPHGCRQQAQQLYRVTHTAVNRENCTFTGPPWLLSTGSATL